MGWIRIFHRPSTETVGLGSQLKKKMFNVGWVVFSLWTLCYAAQIHRRFDALNGRSPSKSRKNRCQNQNSNQLAYRLFLERTRMCAAFRTLFFLFFYLSCILGPAGVTKTTFRKIIGCCSKRNILNYLNTPPPFFSFSFLKTGKNTKKNREPVGFRRCLEGSVAFWSKDTRLFVSSLSQIIRFRVIKCGIFRFHKFSLGVF